MLLGCVCFTSKQQLQILFWISQFSYFGIHYQLQLVWVPHEQSETCSWIIYNCTFYKIMYLSKYKCIKKSFADITYWTSDLQINVSLILGFQWIWMLKRGTVFTFVLLQNLVTWLRKFIKIYSCFPSNWADIFVPLHKRYGITNCK
jgi:hypothetical protein